MRCIYSSFHVRPIYVGDRFRLRQWLKAIDMFTRHS